MDKIKKGDKVIALSNAPFGGQQRKKGTVYVVKNVMFCQSCGTQFLNTSDNKIKGETVCGECGHNQSNWGLNWSSSSFYKKVIGKTREEFLQDCIDNDDFETAILIRDSQLEKKQ